MMSFIRRASVAICFLIAEALTAQPLQIAGVVTTLAGMPPGFKDGVGSEARFNWPYGVATDGTSLYIADFWNHEVRKIVIATGKVTTLAGSAGIVGSRDGKGSEALFSHPRSIAATMPPCTWRTREMA